MSFVSAITTKHNDASDNRIAEIDRGFNSLTLHTQQRLPAAGRAIATRYSDAVATLVRSAGI